MLRLLFLTLLVAPVALAQTPADPLAQARALLADGEAQSALDLLGADTTQDAAYLRGLALADQARFPDASDAFAQADTSSRRVQMAWAKSLEAGGRTDDARAMLARAYAQDTTHTATALAYARHLSGTRRWTEADPVYAALVQADTSNAYLRARLAFVHLQQDRTDDAIVGYEIALQLDPADRSSLLALTRIYIDTESPISAKRAFDRLVAQHADDPDVWRQRRRDRDEARAVSNRRPTHPDCRRSGRYRRVRRFECSEPRTTSTATTPAPTLSSRAPFKFRPMTG